MKSSRTDMPGSTMTGKQGMYQNWPGLMITCSALSLAHV